MAAAGELHRCNWGGAFEAGKRGGLHRSRVSKGEESKKGLLFAVWGKFICPFSKEKSLVFLISRANK